MKFYDWVYKRFIIADNVGTMAFLLAIFMESDNGQNLNDKSKEEVHALLKLDQMMDDTEMQADFDALWLEWERA